MHTSNNRNNNFTNFHFYNKVFEVVCKIFFHSCGKLFTQHTLKEQHKINLSDISSELDHVLICFCLINHICQSVT